MKKIFLIIWTLFLCSTAWAGTKTWQNGGVDNNWSTAGNWAEGSKPAAGDDVVISAAYNCVVNEATANLKSLDMTGYANTLSGSSAINVIGAASATSSVKFAGTVSWTGTLNLNPTAADTNIELTSNGKTLAAITINGNSSGEVFFIDAINLTGRLTNTSGTLHVDGLSDNSGLSHTVDNIYFYSASSKTEYMGNADFNCTKSSGTALTIGSNLNTFDDGTSEFILTGASPSITAQLEIYDITATGGGTFTIASMVKCHNFTFTGTNVKTDGIKIDDSTWTISNSINIDGYSSTNRAFFYGGTLGTQISLTVTGATVSGSSNLDIRDIAFVSTGAVDFSGITGGSGDCGGNTISGGGTLSFTTADDWYWYNSGAGTYNLSDYSHWYEENAHTNQMASTRTILPQDTCYLNADSVNGATTIDQDLPRIPGLNFSNVDAVNFHMNNIIQRVYGSLILSSNVTATITDTYFAGRGSHSINLGGNTPGTWSYAIESFGGTYTLTNNFQIAQNATFYLDNGTFDAAGYNLNIGSFSSSNSRARTLWMGEGVWTIRQGGGWAMGTITNLSNPTTMAETSTVSFENSTSNSTFAGGGCTYYNWTTTTSSGIATISGSNTFNTFTINAPKTVKFTAGTTQTVSSFVATGTAGNTITLDSTSASAATLVDNNGGTNTVYYTTIGTTGAVNVSGATWKALTTDNNTLTAGTGWTTSAEVTSTGRRRSWYFN